MGTVPTGDAGEPSRDISFNRDWRDKWRHYKTLRGARAYVQKHWGTWIVAENNPKYLTKREAKELGLWVVGRHDEYLHYRKRFGEAVFDDAYAVREVWRDGVCIYTNIEV